MAPVAYTTPPHKIRPAYHRLSPKKQRPMPLPNPTTTSVDVAAVQPAAPALANGGSHALGLGLPRSVAATSALDDMSRRVREQSDRLQSALMPVADSIKSFADTNPVVFTFLAIFALLSSIPVACFLGFVVAVSVFFTGTAVIVLCMSVSATVFFASAILLPVLIFTGTCALVALCVLLGLFLAHRLYLHLADASAAQPSQPLLATVREGLRSWGNETRSRVGLGPYTYRPAAFEDYKAFDAVYDAKPQHGHGHGHQGQHGLVAHVHGQQLDYSEHHPQPTPSHPHVKAEPDLFTPREGRLAAPDTTVVKRESDDDDWEDEN